MLKTGMKNIFFIALNTVREIHRQRVFYLLIALFLLLVGVGFIAGSLSLNEQKRLSINFSWTACHISLVLMALYFASHLIAHEREKKTILLILAKPVLRGEFIAGKFLGLGLLLFLFLCALTLFVLFVYGYYSQPVRPVLFMAMSGIFMEALLLSALAFLFSSFMSSFLVLAYSFCVFIIGHFVSDFLFFIQKNEENAEIFNGVILALVRVLPDLERLNWRAHALYEDPLSVGEWGLSMLYALCYIVLLLLLANRVFRRRGDVV